MIRSILLILFALPIAACSERPTVETSEDVIVEVPADTTPDEEPNPEWLNGEEAVADAV